MVSKIERARLMSDSAPMAIGCFNKNMDCIDCNHPATEMFGFESKEEYTKNFYRTMPTFQPSGRSSKKHFSALLLQTFEEGGVKCEILCRRIDGILIPTEATLVRAKHEGEAVVIGYFSNLTGIKSAMKEAANTAEIAQMYLTSSPLAMELFDGEHRLLDCNQQALDLLGFSNKTEYRKRTTYLAPAHLYHGIYTRAEDGEYYQRAMREGFVRYEWVFQKENGDKIPCEITRVRMTRPDADFVVSYIHDLSTIRSMAEELKKAEAVERENRAKSQFLAQMSHVLRTPMNAISGLAEIQLQKNNTPDAEEALVQIQRFTQLQLGIISDILDLSNVDAGKMELAEKHIDVPSLIVDIVQINLMGAENEAVKFSLSVSENLPFVILGDELRIKQIANHIIRNAFKYTESGTVTVHFDAETTEEKDANFTFVLTVSDTGSGMTTEQTTGIFSENTRYNEQGNIHGAGAGLGLLITRRLVKLMEGKISVKSEKNVGSTFIVKIPLKAESDSTLGAEIAKNLCNIGKEHFNLKRRDIINYEPMPYGRVLIVDDVQSNLFVAKGLMEPYFLNIETVTGGLASVEKVKNGAEYDIIFMDHMMPDMDGIQATKAILELGYTRPVVALTANAILGQASLFKENGFAGFISKPIDTKHLNEYLMRFIHDKYPEEVRQKARAEASERAAVAPVEQGVSDELAKHFIRDAKNAASVLDTLMQIPEFSANDLKKYTITTHGMKSALANVGVPDLSEVAATLENAGRGAETGIITAETPSFISRLKDVISTFEQKLSDAADAGDDVEDDTELMKTQLTAIQEACEVYSKSAAKKALNALKEGRCSKKTLALLDEISALLLHGEFEEVAETARKYLGEC
ncbi:MAG: ATP-binding protein [Defluviitaleaceae bacterium]|nr:ATP-binding protein [Defluviitaleaceae bacterium]